MYLCFEAFPSKAKAMAFCTEVERVYSILPMLFRSGEQASKMLPIPCELTGPIVVVSLAGTAMTTDANEVEGGVMEMAARHGGKLVSW